MSQRATVRGSRAVAMVVLALLLAGCSAGSGTLETEAGAAQRLEQLAAKERGLARAPATPVATPPGVQPHLLAPVTPGTDEKATITLREALEAVTAASAAPTAPAAARPGPTDPDRRDQALRHYVKGRDAAARGWHKMAILELDKARALDPLSEPVLRQLSRSYLAEGNLLKAASIYTTLLTVAPYDSEALFTVGLAESLRRNFEAAAARLGVPRLRGDAFEHDPAADLIADHHLAQALAHLGYSRAANTLARGVVERLDGGLEGPTRYVAFVNRLYTRRSEIWQSIGDGHCRTGEFERALEAYERSAPLAADPAALRMRVVYANLCLGRVHAAQHNTLLALNESGGVSDRAIRLCAYVAEHVEDHRLLAEAVVSRSDGSPDDAALLRAAAVLVAPDTAVELLRRFLERRPEDLEIFSQLAGWIAARDARAAVELTIEQVAAHPDLAEAYADRLATCARSPAALVAALDQLPPSPARVCITARVLGSIGRLGAAWAVLEEARATWPESQLVVRQRLDVAAALADHALVDAAAEGADPTDARTWVHRSRARRAVGQTAEAVEAASRAHDLAPRDVDALVEVAAARTDHARAINGITERGTLLRGAVAAAEDALAIDPREDAAWSALLDAQTRIANDAAAGTQRSQGGSVSPETEHLRELRERIRREHPSSRLIRRLDARQDMSRQRYEQALEILLDLYESDTRDRKSLALAVAAWTQLEDEQTVVEWLDERLERRPADPTLLAEWVTLQLRRHRYSEIKERLTAVLEAEPAHDHARHYLEQLHARLDEHDQATVYAEERLLPRPQGVRRELELAAVYARAGRADDATERLRWVIDGGAAASFGELIVAMDLAGRLSDSGEHLLLELVEHIVDRFPHAPLSVYSDGLRALARMGEIGDRFERLAVRAAQHSDDGSGTGVDAANAWRQLAQSLVDDGRPGAAAITLRSRLLAEPMPDRGVILPLILMTVAADAAADRPDATIALVREIDARGMLRVGELPVAAAELLISASAKYSILGNDESACRLLVEALALDGEHAMAMNNLGYTRIEMGYSDAQTREWIERAYDAQPQDPNILDTIGWLRYKRGRFEDDEAGRGALRLIEESIERADYLSPEVLDHLGDIKWRLGDEEGARQAWQRVADMLDDARSRQRLIRDYGAEQQKGWGLVVADPKTLFDRAEGAILERVRAKLRALTRGTTPAVAATFEELQSKHPAGAD